jgi:hypothetical protein
VHAPLSISQCFLQLGFSGRDGTQAPEIVPHSGLALLLSTLHGWLPVYPRSCTRGWHSTSPLACSPNRHGSCVNVESTATAP